MKKLILFRHGKSRWDEPVNDRKRDLEPDGIERTKKSARELAAQLDFMPEKWFSSSALRAKRTAEIAVAYFSNPTKIEIIENLYTFSFFDLLKTIKTFSDDFNSAVLFGHNEAFTEFASRMGGQYIEHLPTSGVVWLEFETDKWHEIDKGKTQLILKPKQL